MSLIALGVTGGISAYKAIEVCRGLQQHGHDVVAVMTHAAERFIGPVTFEAITRRPVVTSQWTPGMNADIEHVAIADSIALLLVAPCTANAIGKFAHGIADDFLSSLYLATRAPVLLAPAMNSNMLAHPVVEQNLRTLAERGVHVVDPGDGYLACGWVGKGRLAEPADVVAAAVALLAPVDAAPSREAPPPSALRTRRIVVAAT
jgi:phosphopantothenoylcysteine decarboxylase/phosphopantothenate--cysteine ligase